MLRLRCNCKGKADAMLLLLQLQLLSWGDLDLMSRIIEHPPILRAQSKSKMFSRQGARHGAISLEGGIDIYRFAVGPMTRMA